MSRRYLLPAVLLVGCAGPRPPAPAPAIAYAATATAPVYVATDTVHYVIDAGDAGRVDTRSGYTATMRLTFQPDTGALRVTATLLDFNGTFSNPVTGSVEVDTTAVSGPFVVHVSPLGEIDLVETPSLSDAFQQVTSAAALVRNFFVRLPGRPVRPGDTWTDTIEHRDTGTQMTTDSRSILTATATGDTAVDGRTLLLVRTRINNIVHMYGNSSGAQVTQHLQGSTTGMFLWDVQRHLLAERTEEGRLEGTLDLPTMGVTGLRVQAGVHRHVRLQPATPD